MSHTTYHAVMAMANALAMAGGEETRVDTDDVRAYVQTKDMPETIRRQFIDSRQEHFIEQSLKFLLDDNMTKM